MGRWIGAIPPGGTSTSYGSATGFGEFDNDGRGVYKGDWKDGKRHGQGECRWPNGNVYKGGWKDDKQHGQGEYRYANGDVYKGGFQNGGRHGQGTMTRADGTVEIGRWEKGKLVEPNTARAAEQKAAAAAKEKAAAREKAARDKKAASEARIAAEQEAAALAEQLAEMKATAEAEQKAASLAKQVADMKNKLVEPNTPKPEVPDWADVFSDVTTIEETNTDVKIAAGEIAKAALKIAAVVLGAGSSLLPLLEMQAMSMGWNSTTGSEVKANVKYDKDSGTYTVYQLERMSSSKDVTVSSIYRKKTHTAKLKVSVRKATAGNDAAKEICQQLANKAAGDLVGIINELKIFA